MKHDRIRGRPACCFSFWPYDLTWGVHEDSMSEADAQWILGKSYPLLILSLELHILLLEHSFRSWPNLLRRMQARNILNKKISRIYTHVYDCKYNKTWENNWKPKRQWASICNWRYDDQTSKILKMEEAAARQLLEAYIKAIGRGKQKYGVICTPTCYFWK